MPTGERGVQDRGRAGGVSGSLPVGCSRQRPRSELRSLQGPRATGSNKPSRALPSHLVVIYALTGTCIEIWAWKDHVPHILPPKDSRGANRAAWLVHLLCLPLGRLCLPNEHGSRAPITPCQAHSLTLPLQGGLILPTHLRSKMRPG